MASALASPGRGDIFIARGVSHWYLHIFESLISLRLRRVMCGKAWPFRDVSYLFWGLCPGLMGHSPDEIKKLADGEAEASPHIGRQSRKKQARETYVVPMAHAVGVRRG